MNRPHQIKRGAFVMGAAGGTGELRLHLASMLQHFLRRSKSRAPKQARPWASVSGRRFSAIAFSATPRSTAS